MADRQVPEGLFTRPLVTFEGGQRAGEWMFAEGDHSWAEQIKLAHWNNEVAGGPGRTLGYMETDRTTTHPVWSDAVGTIWEWNPAGGEDR